MDLLMQDVRYGVRRLAASPLFTVMAVLIIGLGIAANTAVFSVVNAFLFRPLPFVDADRLVEVQALVEEGELEGKLRVAPMEALGLVPDVAVAVVIEPVQLARQTDAALVWRLGELAGAVGDLVEVKASRGGRRERQRHRRQQR